MLHLEDPILKERIRQEGNSFVLTLQERKRILTRHIFGVDIDPQAVEVTKLSLLLKLLEGEKDSTITGTALLPDLSANIRVGDSIVEPDFLVGNIGEEDLKLPSANHAFDWASKFPDVFRESGGFDIIIGNPPWVDIKGMNPTLVDYYFKKYSSTQNRMNIYATFLHRAIDLLKDGGRVGFVTPSSYFTQSSYRALRRYLFEKSTPMVIIRLPDNVFEGVTAEIAVTILAKRPPIDTDTCEVLIYRPNSRPKHIERSSSDRLVTVPPILWSQSKDGIIGLDSNDEIAPLLAKVERSSVKLEEVCDFSLGLTPYDKHRGHTKKQITDQVFHADRRKNKTFRKLLEGGDIKRFSVQWNGQKWISYGPWLGAPREARFFKEPRIIVRQIISGEPPRIYAAFTDKELYNTQIGFNLLVRDGIVCSPKFILAILNSKLMSAYRKTRYLDAGKVVFQKILIQDAKQFPIKLPDFKKPGGAGATR